MMTRSVTRFIVYLAFGVGLGSVALLLLPHLIAPDLPHRGRELAFLSFNVEQRMWEVRRFDVASGLSMGVALPNIDPGTLSWSPDGRYLLATVGSTGREIMRVDLENGEMQRLPGLGERDQMPVWSPDDRLIAFVSSPDTDPIGRPSLYVMNTDGEDVRRLTDSDGSDVSPTWSPDGSRIAFVSDRQRANGIYTVPAAGGSLPTRLTDNSLVSFAMPAWSPAGDRLAFVSRKGAAHVNVYTLDIASGTLTQLTRGSFVDTAPAWSPDGESLVFISNRFNPNGAQLFIMDADGTGLRMLEGGYVAAGSPAWRP
ncbi:MAG: hypothetical protein ACOCZH_00410 [Phototrophicaceae bacterium]